VTATDTNLEQSPHSHGLPTPGSIGSGSPPERFTSRNPEDFAVPTGREEEWRFTPLRKLRPLFNSFQVDSTVRPTWVAPAEVTVEVVAADDALIGSVLRPADRVSALALANVRHALVVRIPAVELSEPVWVTITGKPGLNYGHVVIDAAPNSKATVILDHLGSATLAANVETIVGDGANLTVVSVQDWDADAIHLAAHASRVDRDAKLTHVVINLGGSIVRLNPTVEFGGRGGQAELYGLSFAGDGQHQESRLHVDHAEPNCSSNVVYKSALDGETARTVWIGDVRIRPTATGTKTYELNRNLLLSDGARADSVPNLEIETGEIAGAGHASATGRFDDLQLFYLESRGIPEEDARRLVVRGFFADILKYVKVEALHDRLMDTILTRLGAK
jgi:Fe-S cluster assembly protein SufD